MSEGVNNNEMQHLEAEAIYADKSFSDLEKEAAESTECVHMPEQCLNCNMLGLYENCPDENSLRQIEIDVRLDEINKLMPKLITDIKDVGDECKELKDLIEEEKKYWHEMEKVV